MMERWILLWLLALAVLLCVGRSRRGCVVKQRGLPLLSSQVGANPPRMRPPAPPRGQGERHGE